MTKDDIYKKALAAIINPLTAQAVENIKLAQREMYEEMDRALYEIPQPQLNRIWYESDLWE